VVDAEDVVAVNTESTRLVELLRARQVVPERLLDDDAAPARRRPLSAMPVRRICSSTVGNAAGRDRQVERGVALRPGVALGLAQHLGELVEGVVVVEGAGQEADVSASRCHTSSRNSVRAPLRAASRASSSKSPSPQSRRAKPSSTKPGRQQPAVGQVVHGRDELLLRQVAGDAEDDQRARGRAPAAVAGRGRRAAG
jgi:hypothetical protein